MDNGCTFLALFMLFGPLVLLSVDDEDDWVGDDFDEDETRLNMSHTLLMQMNEANESHSNYLSFVGFSSHDHNSFILRS